MQLTPNVIQTMLKSMIPASGTATLASCPTCNKPVLVLAWQPTGDANPKQKTIALLRARPESAELVKVFTVIIELP